jgi:hypothetical protein
LSPSSSSYIPVSGYAVFGVDDTFCVDRVTARQNSR